MEEDSDSLAAAIEVSTSCSPLAAMEVSTSSELDAAAEEAFESDLTAAKALSLATGEVQESLMAATPSRITGIGEGEIQRLIGDLEGLSSSIVELAHGLKLLRNPLVAVSETEDPSITAKCWTKQVRKLCYDTGDYLDDFMHSGNEFKLLGARALNASGRHKRYKVGPEAPSKYMKRRFPPPHKDLSDHVHKDMVGEVAKLMGNDKELRVVSIVGSEGVGKTILAKRLWKSIGVDAALQCRAFLKASPKPDIRRLLTSMFMQIQRKRPSCRLNVYELIESIATYLRNKWYFIIIDDIWSATVWEIISPAFPDGDCGSRIITTTQMKGVALACCGHQSKDVFNMVPLTGAQSRNLFFGIVFGSFLNGKIVFGSESDCPGDLAEVSDGIIRKCGGLPLATINIASMLPSELNLEQWTRIQDSLPSTWSTNPTSEWMKEVVNLMFSTLRPHLKTCLLYFNMYPEGYIVRKDDLIKQWVVEGVLDGIEGQATEEVAGLYFDELVRRGMIQPINTNNNGKVVLSCTLHHTVRDVIVKKSMEENFVIIADYFQSAIPLPDKVRRLSVQFGGARSAYIPESIMVSEVRSLAFFGFLQCFLSASTVKFRNVRVLILHIWADEDKDAFDLTGIRELLRLRYLKVSCNIAVKLPDEIQGQQYLETLEVHATVVAIPWDIGGLSRLSSLSIAVRKLSTNDIIFLQILPALTALSLNLKTEPTETIVLDEGGFLNLKFFTLRCSAPLLLIEEKAMPKIEMLSLCLNAHQARPDGEKPITIERLESLQEISVIIGGAVADAGSALVDALTNHPRNPAPMIQFIESREDQEHSTLEEQDEIMEEDTYECPGNQEEGSGDCQNTEKDRDETQDESLGKEETKDADSRISMQTGWSSRLPVPVGWGIATAGWILSPVFTRLVDKALSHMEPGELIHNVSKLAADMIPRLKHTIEATESSEFMISFEKLVKELKSNFYDLEETLDEVEYDRLESQLTGPSKRDHASIFDAGPSNQSIAFQSSQKLQESVTTRLTENLEKIEQALQKARDNIKLEQLPSNRRSTQHRLEVEDRHKNTSSETRVHLIGRDEHLKKITELLHGRKAWRRGLLVISIYGIAGSGKTTLAQNVYRTEKNAANFKVFMWIQVSRNFSVREILREMLQKITVPGGYYRKDYIHDLDENELRKELKRVLLLGQSFLLVLDDIWCVEDSDKLYKLLSVLLEDIYDRIKILVTSRNKNAVSAIGYDVVHTTIDIDDLSEKDFSSLFMFHALGGNKIDEGVRETLKGIGAHIVKRLNGSPLAAALVGGLLRKDMTADHWISVRDDPYLLKGVMGILWLCYQRLDEQARRCFAYCGIFPKRHRFGRDDLVKLWVAEGFIEGTDPGQMEDIGNDYFGELVSRSFMQPGEKDSNGGKEYFLVHDLLHDIAEQVSGYDFFRIENDIAEQVIEVPLDVRHVVVNTSDRFYMEDVVKLEKLRSLIILNCKNSIGNELRMDIPGKKIRLRMLVVEQAFRFRNSLDPYSLPAFIGDLKHLVLRYVALRWEWPRGLIVLPDAFTKSGHVQVLDVGYCERLLITCHGVGKLINLWHLISGVCGLTRLESLPFFRITKYPGFGSDLSELAGLDKLKGRLQIVGLELVESKDEALKAKLADKVGLRELVLQWDSLGYYPGRKTDEGQAGVFEGLCPSEHLEELEIINYNGEKYPDWMVCDQHRSWRVQRLVLKRCSPLVTLSSPFFSNLLRLTFQNCDWDELPDHMEHLERLIVLVISRCGGITSLPELPPALKYLEIYGCRHFARSCTTPEDPNWKKIQHIERKFIGYDRLQDSWQYPDEHGVFFADVSLESLPFFQITEYPGFGSELSELAGLDKLKGKLQIVGLEFVKSKDEALKAKLADKVGLRELVLQWDSLGYFPVRKTDEGQAGVFEGLCPSEHLEELKIINYNGEKYPDWMVCDQHRSWRVQRLVLKRCSPLVTLSSPFFSNLLRLTIKDCGWNRLPEDMEHLEKLSVLVISLCWRIRSLPELPPSLKYLEIHDCYFLASCCKTPENPNWKKIQYIERKFIGYNSLQDSSQYPDEHGVFSADAS